MAYNLLTSWARDVVDWPIDLRKGGKYSSRAYAQIQLSLVSISQETVFWCWFGDRGAFVFYEMLYFVLTFLRHTRLGYVDELA